MGRYIITQSVEVDAPAAVVWDVIADLPRYGEWNPFVVAAVSSLKPGDAIDMRVKLGARVRPQREWIVSVQPGGGFAYDMTPVRLGLSSHRTHRIESRGEARSLYTSYFHLEGWLRHLVVLAARRQLEAGFGAMTAAIKVRAEALARPRTRT